MCPQPLVKVAGDDVVVVRRLGGEVRILLSPNTVDATDGFMGTITLGPGEYLAEHYNPYSDKFCYVVRGSVAVRIDGTETTLDSDEALMVRRGQRHRFENRTTEPALIVFHICPLAPRPELGHVETEELPNPEAPPPVVGAPNVGNHHRGRNRE
jgi:putative monooxygenase